MGRYQFPIFIFRPKGTPLFLQREMVALIPPDSFRAVNVKTLAGRAFD